MLKVYFQGGEFFLFLQIVKPLEANVILGYVN